MLDNLDLDAVADKADYAERLPVLGHRLYTLQPACRKAGIPVMVAFEGWDSRGQARIVAKLTEWLDPRHFHFYPIRGPRSYESSHPWLWRFWQKLPAHGEWSLFSPSWYGRVLVERVARRVSAKEWKRAYDEINQFERTLVDNGYLLIKFWLHLSEDEVRSRYKKSSQDPYRSRELTPLDRSHQRQYPAYLKAAENMFDRTHTDAVPWTPIAATDRRHARLKVFETLVDTLERRLALTGDAATA